MVVDKGVGEHGVGDSESYDWCFGSCHWLRLVLTVAACLDGVDYGSHVFEKR